MAEVADFVVIDRNHQDPATDGHWRSPKFATGGASVLTVDGKERYNAYVTLTFRIPGNLPEGHLLIRIIVNENPLPDLVFGVEDTMNTTMATFPASYLVGGGNNIVELHSQGEIGFTVDHAIVHFRRNT